MIDLNTISVTPHDRTRPPLYEPPRRNLLYAPGIGRLLRWRWGRLALQLPLLLVAALLIYDGFTGPELASQNLATTSIWVHYRGFIILALVLAGNLFCMGCPFTLPRTLATRLSGGGRRWPRALRNKWLAVAAFVFILFAYEWLDLWASPWLTAWLVISYFGASFLLEALFAESPFCKYVCPLGTFNFVASTASPTQITVSSQDVCRTCVGKECVNGNQEVLGCGTELFPPTINSNLDCVLCLDCARACPHDNVALTTRVPGRELVREAWPRRWDISFMVFVFAAAGLSNAFGMVPPFYELQLRLAALLNTTNEAILLGLTFAVANLLLPAVAGLVAAFTSRALSGVDEPLRVSFSRFAPAAVPLAVAIWLAHYGFHFATGALALIPVTQTFLIDHQILLLGSEPAWQLGPILPGSWLLPLQILIVAAGFGLSLYVANRIGRRDFGDNTRAATLALLPWVMLLAGLALAAMATFNLPMEMRGTIFFGG